MEEDNEIQSKFVCCDVNSMCGKSLEKGVMFIGISAMVVSLISLIMSIASIVQLSTGEVQVNQHPILAINMVFGLICFSLSTYQIIVSVLLLWQTLRARSNVFLCSLWYVSHLSILTLYFMLFTARTVVCFREKLFLSAVVTMLVTAVYEGTFVYFTVVVNSYLHSLDRARYF